MAGRGYSAEQSRLSGCGGCAYHVAGRGYSAQRGHLSGRAYRLASLARGSPPAWQSRLLQSFLEADLITINADTPLSSAFTDRSGFTGQLRPKMFFTTFTVFLRPFFSQIFTAILRIFAASSRIFTAIFRSWGSRFRVGLLSRLDETTSYHMNCVQICPQA